MKHFLPLLLILTISCNSTKESVLLENLSNSLHETTESRFASIRRINDHELPIKPLLYEKFNFLDSIYDETRALIEGKSQEEIQQLLDDYTVAASESVSKSYEPGYVPNAIPSNNAVLFAKIELAMLTNDIVQTLTADIGIEDVKFDQLRAFVEHGSTSLKLGEAFSGKVYLAAVSSAPNNKVYLLMNGDTLRTDRYSSDFTFKPNQLGIHKVTFEVVSARNSWMTNIGFASQEIEIEIK